MANSAITVPTVESEISAMKQLTPAQRARLVAAASADAAKRATERALEVRRKAVARTKAVRERMHKPVPASIGAALGGAAAEVVRRQIVGRLTSNVYGQALGLAVVGGLAQLAEEGLGIPGLGALGVGHLGVAGMLSAVKLGYDAKDKRDPVALALEETTVKAKKDRAKQKNGGSNAEEKTE